MHVGGYVRSRDSCFFMVRQPQQTEPAPRRGMSDHMRTFLTLLVMLLMTGLVLSELLHADLVTDDDRAAVVRGKLWASHYDQVWQRLDNDVSDSWHEVFDIFVDQRVTPVNNTSGFYQPLVALSLMVDAFTVDDWQARGFFFHRTNLAIHLLNVGLVFALLRRWGKGWWWPALLTMVFALHPLQVESVASIAQRMTLLATTWALLATLCYLRYATTLYSRWMVATMIAYAAILLTRPLFIALPVVFLLLDIWPLQRHGWRPLLEKIPLIGLLIVGHFLVQSIRADAQPAQHEMLGGISLLVHSLAALLVRLVVPIGLLPHSPTDVSVGTFALGMWFDASVLAVLMLLAAWAFRHRARGWLVGLGGCLLLVAPALLQAPYSSTLLSDQYLYAALILPLLALSAAIGLNNEAFRPRMRQWVGVIGCAVVASLAVGSYAQSTHWTTERLMALRTRDLYPERALGYVKLVEAYIRENDLEAALAYAKRAADKEQNDASTQFYLGTLMLLNESSRSADAIEPLQRALKNNPDWIECLQNLAVAYARGGKPEEAITYYERARDLSPQSAAIRVGLGNAYLSVARYASARGEFAEALRVTNDPNAHLGLAAAWAALDLPEYALRHLTAAVAKNPDMVHAAGRSRLLRKYADRPEFADLIDTTQQPIQTDLPFTSTDTSFGS